MSLGQTGAWPEKQPPNQEIVSSKMDPNPDSTTESRVLKLKVHGKGKKDEKKMGLTA